MNVGEMFESLSDVTQLWFLPWPSLPHYYKSSRRTKASFVCHVIRQLANAVVITLMLLVPILHRLLGVAFGFGGFLYSV